MIWPFASWDKPTTHTIPQLTSIRVRALGEYTPQADITPQEVALLIPVLASGTWGYHVDEWIEKHNLTRHFTKIEEE